MPKVKTSLNLDSELWEKFRISCLKRFASSRVFGREVDIAIRDYLSKVDGRTKT